MYWNDFKEEGFLFTLASITLASEIGVGYYTFKFIKKSLCNYNFLFKYGFASAASICSYITAGFIVGNLAYSLYQYVDDGHIEFSTPIIENITFVTVGVPPFIMERMKNMYEAALER